MDAASEAGFFDEVVEPVELLARAREIAIDVSSLDARAHKASKRQVRAALIRRIRYSIPLDLISALRQGIRRGR